MHGADRIVSKARANAIKLEVKKDALLQRQNGDWKISFTVASIDMHPSLTGAAMGTRFACVLVEVGDDEEPVDHQAMDRDKWRALGPAKQAGIRCKDPLFWAYLRECELDYYHVDSEETAASAVRNICNVLTRSDLGKPGFGDQRFLWFDLDTKFQAWKVKEHG
jgi:hypothetical protein